MFLFDIKLHQTEWQPAGLLPCTLYCQHPFSFRWFTIAINQAFFTSTRLIRASTSWVRPTKTRNASTISVTFCTINFLPFVRLNDWCWKTNPSSLALYCHCQTSPVKFQPSFMAFSQTCRQVGCGMFNVVSISLRCCSW